MARSKTIRPVGFKLTFYAGQWYGFNWKGGLFVGLVGISLTRENALSKSKSSLRRSNNDGLCFRPKR